MKAFTTGGFLAALLSLTSTIVLAQVDSTFDVAAYKEFLSTHRDLTSTQLATLYPAGTFSEKASTVPSSVHYFDSIDAHYALTSYEKSLLEKHSFVVTERLRPKSFGGALLEVYNNDLPVFISTDAILHALHMSCDAILMDVEKQTLIPKLDAFLSATHGQLPTLSSQYIADPAMRTMLNDVDIYLTVSRDLLGGQVAPKFSGNDAAVQDLLNLIKAEKPNSYLLFSSTRRTIDFSQFTVRGHYTQTKALSQYFQAMMWLGRTELYLIPPKSADTQQSPSDVQRQIIDAVLIKEAVEGALAMPQLNDIDAIIRMFCGESDNITLPNIQTLIGESGIANAAQLLDTNVVKTFQSTLAAKSNAFQRINSQILMSDPCSPDQIQPASAFLLLGQRFEIDSYTTGNVVYDRILFQNQKMMRMLPSTLDVLFALGNDGASQLLQPELDKYKYASNLAALRYLADSYEPAFWQSTVYNGWLNSIRALNPPAERSALPPFMRTAAWWQEKMNTQLASWAQLRHDFILYAKQSYSGGVICSYPETYVEPTPQFFDCLSIFAKTFAAEFQKPLLSGTGISHYFSTFALIADTLASISGKELTKTPLTEREKLFLKTIIYSQPFGCGIAFAGWYPRLFYTGVEGFTKTDMIIADIHTAPTDAAGIPIGWVLHAGTGPLNLAVVVAELPDGRTCSFVGPVMSYYQHLAINFKRLTDEEWKTMYNVTPSMRPAFVNIYLADSVGASRGDGPSLVTGIWDGGKPPSQPRSIVMGKNFPNPFNSSTIIPFIVPDALSNVPVQLIVYDVQGRVVKRLMSQRLPAGNYVVRWDGTSENGLEASTGIYFYHLIAGHQRQVGKMSLVK